MVKRAIDGFVPRDDSVHRPTVNERNKAVDFGDMGHAVPVRKQQLPLQQRPATSDTNSIRSDIDESLREIGNSLDLSQPVRGSKQPKNGRLKRDWKKIAKRAVIAIVVIVLGIGIFLGVRALMAGNAVFKGDIFGFVQKKPLKQDANGRSNILILGTSEDDAGHEAGYLTDSMMILSIDQNKKNAYMVSVPRDLYVKYGKSCQAGYSGKINAYFNCVNDNWSSDSAEEERQTATRSFVGNIFGIDVQYSVHLNYSVMRDLVGALGGIKITIDSRNPNGVMDSNFDWKCGTTSAEKSQRCPRGHYISYPNGEVELDAEHALYLAMARGDKAPTYGFEQSNFDREKNQQKIMVAIRDKALSAGTLTDFTKVSGIIDAIGKNLRTNFEKSEVRTLVELARDIKGDNIKSVSLIDAEPTILTTGVYGGASSVVPTAGTYDYSQLRSYIKKNLYATDITRENANIVVLNATGISGVAQKQANKLTELGMTVSKVGNAPQGNAYPSNKIYKVSTRAKTATSVKLKSLYGVAPEVAESIPGVKYSAEADYVVIVATKPSTGE